MVQQVERYNIGELNRGKKGKEKEEEEEVKSDCKYFILNKMEHKQKNHTITAYLEALLFFFFFE